MNDLVTDEYIAAVLIRFAQAQSSDAAIDDLTVPLARELGEAHARIEALEAADKAAAIYFQRALKERDVRIEALEAAGKRLAEAVRAFLEMDDPDDMAAGNTDSVTIATMRAQALAIALAAWRAAEKGGG